MAGYPAGAPSARVLQSPTSYTGGIAGARPANVASSQMLRSSPMVQQAGQARPVAAGQPVARAASTVGAGVVGAAASARPARVVNSSGQPVTAAPASQGIRTVAAAPQALTRPVAFAPSSVARPARVVSASEVAARPNTLAGPANTQAAYEVKHKDDPQLQNLKELRKSCGLKNVPVNDALQAFKSMSSDGKLTREQFLGAYTLLLQKFEIAVPQVDIQNAVFDLFDRDDNGVVDMMELICGASLLCTGSEEDKIHAVFNVFDENGDGVISMDEMFKFLTSVFKVVLTPNVMAVMNSMGVAVDSPEDLASVTALECFKTADLNHDGRLSVAEFKAWFFAPRNDPSFLFSPVRKLLQ